MQIKITNVEDLERTGVYQIINLINHKTYIGSTRQSFKIRMKHHVNALRRGDHKNAHLQHAWNKYGENNFEFSIVEICDKKDTYITEQKHLNDRDVKNSYNINPNATGLSECKETREKLAISHRQFQEGVSSYYHQYKNGNITLNDIPEKYKQSVINHTIYEPWNKGKHYQSTDHLKVKHRITAKVLEKCHTLSEQIRENADIIYVYDCDFNFIDRFRSSIDLANMSAKLNLPIKSRFSVKRGKCDVNELQSCNINRAVKTGKPYKGMYFTNVPLHPGMDDVNEPKSVNTVM